MLALCLLARVAYGGAVIVQVQAMRNGVGGLGTAIQPTSVVVSPDGLHVYAVSEIGGTASIDAFARNTGDGTLTYVEHATGQPSLLSGPLAITPDGAHLLLPGAALTVHSRDALTGHVAYVEQHMEAGGPGGFSGAQAVAVSPDSAHVYGLARLPGTGLAVFERNAATGALTAVEVQQDGVGGVSGLTGARDVTVSPDGAHVYVAGSGGAVVFQRNVTTGALTLVTVQTGIALSNLRVSPDGAHAYATDADFEVAAFLRNPDGTLTLVEGSLDGTNGPAVGIDPAGAYVYNPISLYTRDATTGRVALRDQMVNAIGGIAYIGGARAVAVSPDGAHFYVAAPLDSALPAFRPRVTVSCSPAPTAPCRSGVPLGGTLILKDRPNDDDDKMTWKWKKGAATLIQDFDDPPATFNDYVLCLYDASGAAQPVLEAGAPAGALWTTIPTGVGYRYRDPRPAPVRDGVLTADLRAGVAGKAKAGMVARRRYLPMPALPLTLPVTAQLQSTGGECWGSTYSTTIISDATLMRARSD